MRTLLKNGKIYDGSGKDAFAGDILIEDEKIAAVGPAIDETADEVIDLGGLSVSSGFFDAHSHNDWFAIKKEPVKYFEPFIRQGITSFIAGNCGLSAVGFDADTDHLDQVGGGLFGTRATPPASTPRSSRSSRPSTVRILATWRFSSAIAPPAQAFQAGRTGPSLPMKTSACWLYSNRASGKEPAAFPSA